MFEYIFHNVIDTFRRQQNPFPVDVPHFGIRNIFLFAHGTDIIDAKRQHIFIPYRIHYRIGMQSFAENLVGSHQIGTDGITGQIFCQNRGSGKTEGWYFLKLLVMAACISPNCDRVTFIENDDAMPIECRQILVFLIKYRQFLNSGNNDARRRSSSCFFNTAVLSIAVGSPFFKSSRYSFMVW